MSNEQAHNIVVQVAKYAKFHRLRRNDVDTIAADTVVSMMTKGLGLNDPLMAAYVCNHIKRFVQERTRQYRSPVKHPVSLSKVVEASLPAVVLDDASERSEDILAMKDAVKNLPPYLRKVIDRHLRGMTTQEIAKDIGSTPHKVAQIRCRAVKELRKIMNVHQ